MPDTNTTLPTAGLIRRLMAIVYDSLLLLGIAFAYGVILTIIRIGVLGRDELDYVNIPFIIHLLSWALLWGILAGYYVLCWTKRGQTLGMKTWRLRVEGSDGRTIDAKTAWLRCALALVSALAVGLGYLWCLYDKSGGCWHDRWSSSRVVQLPKEKKG